MRNKLFLNKIMKDLKVLWFCYFIFSLILRTSTSLDNITSTQSISDGETLISHGGTFELGFFSPGSSKNRYLGIWYYNMTPLTVVWVANRERPLNNTSGALKLTDQGLIVLVDGTNDSNVWSSNIPGKAENPVAQLLDSGNLIVKDGHNEDEEHFLWQSFDYPGDTLLPGMKLGWDLVTGLEKSTSSWKSADDPGRGKFIAKVDRRGYPQISIQRKGTVILRLGPWNGLTFSGAALYLRYSQISVEFVFNEKEIFYKYQLVDASNFVRRVVTPWGNAQVLHWSRQTKSWDVLLSIPEAECDKYDMCGANAVCGFSNTPAAPICTCLKGFAPKYPQKWNESIWSNGCVRVTPLSCSNDGFRKLTSLMLPDASSSWYNKTMNLQECKDLCLRNCSCIAYANLDILDGGSGCLLWFHDLNDMRQGVEDLYIRVPVSELDGYLNKESSKKKLAAIMVGSILFIMSIILGLSICVWKKKLEKPEIFCWKPSACKRENKDIDLPTFDLATILYATNNFSGYNKLGEGGFGLVYKGILANGTEIAVKRLSKNSEQGLQEFKTEVQLIAKLQHRNLVKLLGCCIQQKEKLLIYEFMPNRSLDYFIFGSCLNNLEFMVLLYCYHQADIRLTLNVLNMPDDSRKKLLDWAIRFRVICGTARGLLYLHQDSRLRIIHRDLKTSNILLDKDMNAKISDFGLARTLGGDQTEATTKRVMGTYGYISPEYAMRGSFSVKSDMFSFGVIVLEVVSGRKNREFCVPHQDLILLGYAWKLWNEERPMKLVEESLGVGDSVIQAQVLRCIHIGLLCVQERPDDRPNMSSVIHMLNDDKPLPRPRQPAFYFHQNSSSPKDSEMCSTNEASITLLDAR